MNLYYTMTAYYCAYTMTALILTGALPMGILMRDATWAALELQKNIVDSL